MSPASSKAHPEGMAALVTPSTQAFPPSALVPEISWRIWPAFYLVTSLYRGAFCTAVAKGE